MAIFDKIIAKKSGFKGYTGNPPVDEADYNSRKDEMFDGEAPTWTELVNGDLILQLDFLRAGVLVIF